MWVCKVFVWYEGFLFDLVVWLSVVCVVNWILIGVEAGLCWQC